jgi:hypothetical protein
LLVGSDPKNERNFLKQMLDLNGDGSIIDDVAEMFLGGDKKQSGEIVGILGSHFEK